MNNVEAFWEFLTGGAGGYFVFSFLLIGGLLLLTLIFQAACALADVTIPSFLYSLLLVVVTLAVTVPLNAFIAYLSVGSFMHAKLGNGGLAVVLTVLVFCLCFFITSALYILALRVSVKKGALTGLFEQLLALLAFFLLYGILLVILAVIQIVKPATNKTALTPPAVPTVVTLVTS